MQKYKLALFIGRFQPFHKGHLYSLKKAMGLAERVVIGIGSSQESGTESNPWSYEERERMVRSVIDELRIKNYELWEGVETVAIPDTESDEEWVREIELRIKNYELRVGEVVIVGNNEWVNGLMEEVGYQVVRTGLHKRDRLEGVKIREMMKKGDLAWQKRVSEEVREIINQRKLSDYS